MCLMGVSGGWTTASLLLCPAVPQPLNSHQLEGKGENAHTHPPALSPSLLLMQDGRAELPLTAAIVTRCWRGWRSSNDTAHTHIHIGTLEYHLLNSRHAQRHKLSVRIITHTSNYIGYTPHTPGGHRQLSNCYYSPLKHQHALPKIFSFCLQTCGTVICDWKHPTEQQEQGETFTSLPPAVFLL